MTGWPWLMALALVVAVNPFRVSGRLPSLPVVAIGAAGSAAVYTFLALAAEPALSFIDVSAPTMGVAAGLVLIAGGIRDLLVQPPAPEPALPGWGAALVPVMIPMLTRPQVGVLAFSATEADETAAVVIGGLLMVVVAVLTSRAVGALARRVVAWMAGSAAIITVALGVAFAVEGVLAV